MAAGGAEGDATVGGTCVVALDDRFYVPGEYKKTDFSCNTQFGLQCAAAAGQSGGATYFLDAGAQALSAQEVRDFLASRLPDLLVMIPCGRYRDATYHLIEQAVRASSCRLAVVAGACLPDEPARLLDRLPLVDGVLLGHDPKPLAQVSRQLAVRDTGVRAGATEIPGFAWRCADGSINVMRDMAAVGGLEALPVALRDGLSGFLSVSESRSDRYTKWLLDSSVGCPRQCIYCRTPVISRRQGDARWYPKDGAALAAEMTELAEKSGVREFRFQDDNFLMPSHEAIRRADAFAAALRSYSKPLSFQVMFHSSVVCDSDEAALDRTVRALREVGLERVFLGVESGDAETLLYFRKDATVERNEQAIRWLTDRGLLVISGSVVFHPRTTVLQLEREHRFFRWIVASPLRAALAPLGSYAHIIPGSELESEILERGLTARSEAEFRPADPVAANALAAMLRFRRYAFTHDWFVFTVKRDLVHWQRLEGERPDVLSVLAPALLDASTISVDASWEVIAASRDGHPANLISRGGREMFTRAEALAEAIAVTPFARYWRANLYSAPTS